MLDAAFDGPPRRHGGEPEEIDAVVLADAFVVRGIPEGEREQPLFLTPPMSVSERICPPRSIVARICSEPGVTMSGTTAFAPRAFACSATSAARLMSS